MSDYLDVGFSEPFQGVPDMKQAVPNVKQTVSSVEQAVSDLGTAVSDVKQAVPNVKRESGETLFMPFESGKSVGKSVFDDLLIKTEAVVVVLAITALLSGADIRGQLLLLITFLGLIVAHDPLKLFCQFWARSARYLFTVDCVLIGSEIVLQKMNLGILCCIMVAVTIFLTYYLNHKWIREDKFFHSKKVTAIVRELAVEADNAWQGDGRRETRSLLIQMATQVDENLIDDYSFPAFMIGYLHGTQKQKEHDKVFERMSEDTIRKIKEQYEELQVSYNMLQGECQQERAKTVQAVREYEQIREELESLKLTNERDELVREALQKGDMSYKEISERYGVSKSSISRIKKQMSEEDEE